MSKYLNSMNAGTSRKQSATKCYSATKLIVIL
jgi:hypothetical protein